MAGEYMEPKDYQKVFDVDVIDGNNAEVVVTKDFTSPEDLYNQLITSVKSI